MTTPSHDTLKAPSPAEDKERAARARLFRICYWFSTAWILITVAGNFVGGFISSVAAYALLAMIGLGAIPYQLVKRGHLDLGAMLWLGGSFVATTLGLAMMGTVRAPVLGFYLIIVLCTGLVFGARGMVASVVASSLAVAGLIWAENRGWLPAPDYRVTVAQWITASAFFACVGGLTLAATRQIQASLAEAKAEVEERRRKERELIEANRRLEEALNNVKTLKGLLPLCAWCRKVRSDEGYWSALESYVAKHTDATFTHGICPDCQAKLVGGPECKRV